MTDLAACCRALAGILALIFALALLYGDAPEPPRQAAAVSVISPHIESDRTAMMLQTGAR